MSKKYEVAAIRFAEQQPYQDGDAMSREERTAWIAAIEYARSMGVENNADKVDFAIHCNGTTDLDGAWDDWAY